MQHLQIYTLDERGDDAKAVRIKRMEAIYEAAGGESDRAHRHDYYTAVWVQQGRGEHIIDFQSYPLEENAVFFVSPGQVHRIDTWERPQGWVITFSKSFLQHNHINEDFITEINLFNSFEKRPPILLSSATAKKLDTLLRFMEETALTTTAHQIAALSAYLKLFLVYCESECTEPENFSSSEQSGAPILKAFKKLVAANYQKWHKVSDYADQLNITSKYLNQVVKSLLGQTTKEVIQEKIILNAKRELRYTDQSIKEIAYELGFDDPLYFSSFFKTCTGLSPSAFRRMEH